MCYAIKCEMLETENHYFKYLFTDSQEEKIMIS